MRRLIGALAALMLLGSATDAHAQAPVAGCNAQGAFEVCFNDPAGTAAQQGQIVDRLRQLIQATTQGDRVRIAMYHWTLTGIADDLVAAKTQRHVDVQIVIDKSTEKSAAIQELAAAQIPITSCDGSCTSHVKGSINHLKLFLIDGHGRQDTIITSANLTAGQKTDLYNNLVRITNDAKLFAFYSDYYVRLQNKGWQGWTNDNRHVVGDLGTKGYVFQRTDGDTVAGILGNVTKCETGHAKIWVAMAFFSRQAVQSQLQRLQALGCNVKVIADPDHVSESFAQAGLPKSKVRQLHVHDKYLLIDAFYDGAWRQAVFTGSHNWTAGALLENDETWVRIENPFVFSQYETDYDALFSRSTD